MSTTITPSTAVSTKAMRERALDRVDAPEACETMSPMWLFSNHASGSRSMWLKRVVEQPEVDVGAEVHADPGAHRGHRHLRSPRAARRPMPRTVSRSRSRPTSTRSTTSCRKNGIAIAKTSSASDSSEDLRDRALHALRPRRDSCHERDLLALVLAAGSRRAGVNSIATPVKWREASSSVITRRPGPGRAP